MTLEGEILEILYSHEAHNIYCQECQRVAHDLAERIERSWDVMIGSEAKWTKTDRALALIAFQKDK